MMKIPILHMVAAGLTSRQTRNAKPEMVHTPDYDGPDRRGVAPAGRRLEDNIHRRIPMYAAVAGIVAMLVGWGVAVGVSKAELASKVNTVDFETSKNEQLKTDQRQDLEGAALRGEINQAKEQRQQVMEILTRLDQRVSEIYCKDKPAGCR